LTIKNNMLKSVEGIGGLSMIHDHRDSLTPVGLPSTLPFQAGEYERLEEYLDSDNFTSGFIFLSRSLLKSKEFQKPNYLKVWLWCLLKACHTTQHISIATGKGKTVVTLQRGQFIFGRNSASRELGLFSSSVRNILEQFQKWQNLDIQKDSHYSIITIRNYEDYQNSDNYKGQVKGQAKDRQRTGKGQAKDTYNNVNNDNNKKKKREEGKTASKKPILSDEEWLESLKANKAYEGLDIEKVHGKLLAWCELKGKKPTRARLLNWLNREERPMTGKVLKSKTPINIALDAINREREKENANTKKGCDGAIDISPIVVSAAKGLD